MREVDTQQYISMLREIVNQGKDVNLIISGSSMSPFLGHHRDTIIFGKPQRPLRRGDMVFYQRDNGQFVMHRIYKVHDNQLYDIVGDAQTEIEHDVRRDQIFAIVKQVNRKGKWLKPGDFWWDFFEKYWIRMVPLRPLFVKTYALLFWRKPAETD